MFDLAAACLTLTALLAYLNARFIRLPPAIGVMVIALGLTLGLLALDALGLDHGLREREEALIRSIDFSTLLMRGMLSLLLFAGALHVDLRVLTAYRWQIGGLALLGTLASTLAVGLGLWWVLPWIGLPLSPLECLLFGALISPTDPIAVMGIIKTAGAPRELELVIAGESLFNDGIGVVIFALLLGVLESGRTPSTATALALFAREAGGGLVFGLLLGELTYRLMKSIDQYQVEVLLTLAAVLGGYALASHLHVSGPLAMVVCGVLIGNRDRRGAMSETTRHHLDLFWELVDEMLNAVLFVLIGLQALLIEFSRPVLVGGAVAILVTLLARLATIGWPVRALGSRFELPAGSASVLVWGGLRGGISVALALSLPTGAPRDTVLALTYCVVVFSVLVQGLTIGRLVARVVDRPGALSTGSARRRSGTRDSPSRR